MRLKSIIVTSLLTAYLSLTSTAHSAIQAMASRVIYDGGNKAATLALKNNASKAYMVQAWLENGENNKGETIPFVVTPPLIKIESQKEAALRFIYAGQGLSSDRESQFWINLQEIPPKSDNENVLQLAIRSKIKLFYRPTQIDMRLEDAVKHLHWYIKEQTLYLENDSPLHVTIGDLKLNNQTAVIKHMNQDMVSPYSTIQVLKDLSYPVKSLDFTYINDYGGNEKMPTVQLK